MIFFLKWGDKMKYDIKIPDPKIEGKHPKNIKDILYRRSDLSTFVVHLTKDKDSLIGIVSSWTIEARNIWGLAKNKIKDNSPEAESQKCVCFTETPFEYIHQMVGQIKGRSYELGSYGIAITKRLARNKGVNPVWYVDISPDNNRLQNILKN